MVLIASWSIFSCAFIAVGSASANVQIALCGLPAADLDDVLVRATMVPD
jgi:hypothetical protein